MRYQILTIFPEIFTSFRELGLVGRAVNEGKVQLETTQLRDFAINTHGQIDDSPYGGGSGMVLRCEPAVQAIEVAKQRDAAARVVLFTPRGKPLTQARAQALVAEQQKRQGGFILLCCRYEGVDERVAEHWVDEEISLGDFVMMGGEVAAMAFIEATARLLDGVLGNPESLSEESFAKPMLEYPQYTKPQDFQGYRVPDVLLSGHHAEIGAWRASAAKQDTMKRRPELLEEKAPPTADISVALVHFPVENKQGDIITSSVTNLDVHDIARSARTYGLSKYYIVHPTKAMRRLMEKICEHWATGPGLEFNPNRSQALELISLVPDVDDVFADIERRTGKLPRIVVTSARQGEGVVKFEALAAELRSTTDPYLILLGTGWGLASSLMEQADLRLEPVCGFTDYNHLSVRAACAIMLDRLLGA